MGRSRRNKYPELGERAILGDEEAAAVRSELAEVVTRVDDLTERINAQFTSISAHAEISRAQLSEVRDEARADMERSRDMLVDLIERVRNEFHTEPTVPLAPPPADADSEQLPPPSSSPAHSERAERRLDTLERTIDDVIAALERCEQRQRQMADTMTSFIDTLFDMPSAAHSDPVDVTDEQAPTRLSLA